MIYIWHERVSEVLYIEHKNFHTQKGQRVFIVPDAQREMALLYLAKVGPFACIVLHN